MPPGSLKARTSAAKGQPGDAAGVVLVRVAHRLQQGLGQGHHHGAAGAHPLANGDGGIHADVRTAQGILLLQQYIYRTAEVIPPPAADDGLGQVDLRGLVQAVRILNIQCIPAGHPGYG